MALGRQAKVLTSTQLEQLLAHVGTTRLAPRNRVIVLLAFKAGLRAKEVGGLRWRMVLSADGTLAPVIALEDVASKGRSGRVIPMHISVRDALEQLRPAVVDQDELVIAFQKGSRDLVLRSSAVQELFRSWFRAIGFAGATSHSGRRTFITTAARQLPHVRGGSLRDVQRISGHSSLNITQGYMDTDENAQRDIVNRL